MPYPQPYVFDQVLADALKSGRANFGATESLRWFMNRMAQSTIRKSTIISGSHKAKRDKMRVLRGRMYFYTYDPKHKKTLPFYDKFPLVFILDFRPDHFLGLNLHYLQPTLRIALMRQLYTFASDSRYDQKTTVKVSYQILKSASERDYYKPCLKKYLYPHVKTHFIEMLPAEWSAAAFLPVAQWEKRSQRYIWNWSKGQL